MLAKSILTSWSGSLGGITGSHNQGGLYFRARRIPVNPNSAGQVVVRNAVRELVTRWNAVLTAAQRGGWEIYADNVPLPGPLGDPRTVSGQNQYVRSNVTRLQIGFASVNVAPGVFDLGSFSDPVITVDQSLGTASVGFTNSDTWATALANAMVIYIGNPQNSGITFYGGPYRLLGFIQGNPVPPASPQSFALPFSVLAGQRIGFFVRVTRSDGRLSGRTKLLTTVVA